MPRLDIPYILPLHFVEINPQQLVQYLSRHPDDWLLQNRLNIWQYGTYANKWTQDDSIPLQVTCNTGQPQLQVINCQGQVFITELMSQKQQNRYDPTTYIYESATALDILDDGFYWFKMTSGSITMISEPIRVQRIITESLLLEFKHRKFYGGVVWETGFSSNIRIPGILRRKPPAAKDVVYEDQILDMTMIKSTPYRLIDLIVGAGDMCPDYFIDTLNRILGCSSLQMDGRYYTKNEGFKWEQTDEQYNGVLYSYRGELREMINRTGKIIEPGTDTNQRVTIIGAIDLKGFADTSLSASSNLAEFTDVE